MAADRHDTRHRKISTARIAPGDRATARRFLTRFDGTDLEVALEATTGWRFVVEEDDKTPETRERPAADD